MLKRREFLAGAVGIGAVGTLAAQVVRLPSAGASTVDPHAYGATGDGRSNDLEALEKAFAAAIQSNLPIDGGAAVFAISGNLKIAGAARPSIRSLRLKQLDPVNGRRTLFFDKCQAIRIDSLQVDVGGNKSAGDMNSTGGLWIEGGSGHEVRNVDAFGHGKNTLIAIWSTSDSLYENLTARDAQFDDPAAGDDVIQGIWLSGNNNCVLRNGHVSNLTGNASYVGKRFANLRTRGITLGGNVRVNIIDAHVRNVDQGIDLTGSQGNRQCAVLGGRTSDCGSVGVKLANSSVGCRVEGHVAERAGMYSFLASGPSEAELPFKTHNCDFVRCTAVDPGYNRIAYETPSGFAVRMGDYDRDFPRGIRFIGCRAIDGQPVKTMQYGFYSDVPPQARGTAPNVLIDCASQGHIRAASVGAWQ